MEPHRTGSRMVGQMVGKIEDHCKWLFAALKFDSL
jgi:hypothetical protein